MEITKLQGNIPDFIYSQLEQAMNKFEINTIFRLSHFLGQCSHESAGFKMMEENLNYKADALLRVFPKYFKSISIATAYARKPEAIANKIYSSRMGNGDEASGDGYKFHGRGAIQLTGRDNYKAFGVAVDEDILTHPEVVANTYALLSAAWFFSKNKLNAIADEGINNTTIVAITKRINGGLIGISSRMEETNKFYTLLNS